MKRLLVQHLKAFGLTLALILLASDAYADRGRVKIQDGNVVADNGTRLRGAPFFLDHFSIDDMRNNESTYRNYFKSISQTYNMNLVRICPWIGDWEVMNREDRWYEKNRDDYIYMTDKAVQWAAEDGIYAVVNLHMRFNTYADVQRAKDFWDVFAHRYESRTHVIYELVNEPNPASVKDTYNMRDIYQYVRRKAPSTHLILWSIADPDSLPVSAVRTRSEGIDYSNASVGFHTYDWLIGKDFRWKKAKEYRDNGFPVINTEFFSLTDADNYPIAWEYVVDNVRMAEQDGFSWMQWSPVFNYRFTNQGLSNNDLKFTDTYKNRIRDGYNGVQGIGYFWGKDNGTGTPPPSNDSRNDYNQGSSFAGYKRFKDDWQGFYAHASSTANGATTQAANLRPDWGTQKWEFELAYGNTYRIRNVWTGKYLTAETNQAWSSVTTRLSEPNWSSQRWVLERAQNNSVRIKSEWSGYYLNSTGSEWGGFALGPLDTGWGSMRFYLQNY